MSVIIDTAPPPPPRLREVLESLQPGQSALAPDYNIRVLRVTTSRVKADHPDRRFRTAESVDGPRVWRVA